MFPGPWGSTKIFLLSCLRWSNNPKCSNRSNTCWGTSRGEVCSSRLGHRLAKADCNLPCYVQLQQEAPLHRTRQGFDSDSLPSLTLKIWFFSTQIRKSLADADSTDWGSYSSSSNIYSSIWMSPLLCTQHTKKQEPMQKPGPRMVSNCGCTRDSKFLIESPRFRVHEGQTTVRKKETRG